MIGQTQLQSRIWKLVNDNKFPRFSIFVGPRGSGKKTFCRELIKSITDGLYEECGIKVDEIRQLIDDAYKIHSTAVYFIPDADNMSNAAKNALLKVTEEPPNNAYFIMTLEDENNTLDTIKSRATIFHMDRYAPDEIEAYFKQKYGVLYNREVSIVRDLGETPGDVDIIMSYDADNFYRYVQLVANNIAEVSLGNAFKIPSKLALKDEPDGYDLRLFWKAFMKVCFDMNRVNGIYTTSKYLQQLRIKGINKLMLVDNWILEIRELWM